MADRYWVGGTGTWNVSNTTNWSTSTGGSGGASVPTSSDDVYFDASSGSGNVTVSGTRVCGNLNLSGYAGQISGSSVSVINISGSANLAGANLNSVTGSRNELKFSGTGTHTFEIGGSFVGWVEFTSAGNYTILDSYTSPSIFYFYGGGTLTIPVGVTVSHGSAFFINSELTLNGAFRARASSDSVIFDSMTITGTGSLTSVRGMTFEDCGDVAISIVIETSAFVPRIQFEGLTPTRLLGDIEIQSNSLNIEAYNRSDYIERLDMADKTLGSLYNQADLEFGELILRNSTVSDVYVTNKVIFARNSINGGNNTNITFIDVPANLNTTPTGVININTGTIGLTQTSTIPAVLAKLNTQPSAIINETTNITSLNGT